MKMYVCWVVHLFYFALCFALLFAHAYTYMWIYFLFLVFFFFLFKTIPHFFVSCFLFRIQFTLFEVENYYKASNWYTICANIPSEYIVNVCLCIWFAKKKSNIKYSARCALSFFIVVASSFSILKCMLKNAVLYDFIVVIGVMMIIITSIAIQSKSIGGTWYFRGLGYASPVNSS